MVLPSSGTISLLQIMAEFEGLLPAKLSDYYSDAPAAFTAGVPGVPAKGVSLSVSGLYSKAKPAVDVIASTPGLIGYYDGESWDAVAKRWNDKSGAGNHVTETTGTGIVASAAGGTNGLMALAGNTGDGLRFPVGVLPATYTLFHVARYTSTTATARKRIFDGVDPNWLSGFWEGRTGCAYHNNWMTPTTYLHGNNWVLSTDRNASYRSNKVVRTTAGPGTPSYLRLSLNYGYWGNERSAWACQCIAIYNRTLTDAEVVAIESELWKRYALT